MIAPRWRPRAAALVLPAVLAVLFVLLDLGAVVLYVLLAVGVFGRRVEWEGADPATGFRLSQRA